MDTSTHVNTKRKKRPAEAGTLVGVRLQPDLLTALDEALAAEADEPTRPEMMRRVVTAHLRDKGYLKD